MVNITKLIEKCDGKLSINDFAFIEQRFAAVGESTTTIRWMTPIFSIISFIAGLILVAAIIFALLKRKIPSRKYSIVLSRTSADIFSSVLIASVSILSNTYSASYAFMALFLYITTFGMLHTTLTHSVIIILRHICVTRPYGFQSICSIRRLAYVNIFTWILCIVYAAAYTPLTSVIVYPNRKPSVCTFHGCQKPLIISAICIICISLFTVIASYITVILKLFQISKSEKAHNEPEITKKKLKKFLGYGGHIALYLFISSLILTGSIFLLDDIHEYNIIRSMLYRNCDVAEYMTIVLRLETFAAAAVLLWCVRITFDVVICFFCETRLFPWVSVHPPQQQLRNNQILQVKPGLGWQKKQPVLTFDNHLHPWDFKN